MSIPLKDRIKKGAANLGFQLFGVAAPDFLQTEAAHLQKWLEAGNGALLPFLAKAPDKRADPKALLPEVRSVIMLGMSYAQQAPDLAHHSGKPEGRVSRFALNRDYHHLIAERLSALKAHIRQIAPAPGPIRTTVDTAPLLERAFAQQAGLGFIGKNSCLIHPQHGSFFFLAAVLTALELPPDKPLETKGCGDCRLCLEACPSGALEAPRSLNSRKCFSCLTIETRQPFPSDLACLLHDRIFGCDTCQEVCPYNRKALPCIEEDLKPGPHHPLPTLEEILNIPSNRLFNERFQDTAFLRARKKGLQRNARQAARNIGRKDLMQAKQKSIPPEPRPNTPP